jgi:hypothetical protein
MRAVDVPVPTNESNNYEPVCDGQQMHPGDTCMRFGYGAVSQTYAEMAADHTPDKLATPTPTGARSASG